ncbi:MAG: hypothetical protein WBQ03_20230 [Candidatus Sulfotelmatobacter sp.]
MSEPRRKNHKRATFSLGPVPQIIARIPRPYPALGKASGGLITTELFSIWETSFLSEAELDDLAIATFASICGYSFVLKTPLVCP